MYRWRHERGRSRHGPARRRPEFRRLLLRRWRCCRHSSRRRRSHRARAAKPRRCTRDHGGLAWGTGQLRCPFIGWRVVTPSEERPVIPPDPAHPKDCDAHTYEPPPWCRQPPHAGLHGHHQEQGCTLPLRWRKALFWLHPRPAPLPRAHSMPSGELPRACPRCCSHGRRERTAGGGAARVGEGGATGC
jgi:hypothetical protein